MSSERIVVDNLVPTVSVTYNDPVREVNGIAYYAGDIDATVEIHEANFYAEDVQYHSRKRRSEWIWYQCKLDREQRRCPYPERFRLSEDGDYLITVNYTDRSGNRMETYTSGQLTIDTQHPGIYVSGLQADSANKEEPYGFTPTARRQRRQSAGRRYCPGSDSCNL